METEERKPKEYHLPVNGRVENELPNMRFIDLQRSCIIRGMDFDFVISKSVGTLQSWLIKNWHNPIKMSKLNEFDKLREKTLIKRGLTSEPFVRLGITNPPDITANIESIIPIIKEKVLKKKRERDKKLGIFKGTKKAYVFELVQEGIKVEKIIPKVIKKFPDAKEKSIKIWYKRAIKQIKKK